MFIKFGAAQPQLTVFYHPTWHTNFICSLWIEWNMNIDDKWRVNQPKAKHRNYKFLECLRFWHRWFGLVWLHHRVVQFIRMLSFCLTKRWMSGPEKLLCHNQDVDEVFNWFQIITLLRLVKTYVDWQQSVTSLMYCPLYICRYLFVRMNSLTIAVIVLHTASVEQILESSWYLDNAMLEKGLSENFFANCMFNLVGDIDWFRSGPELSILMLRWITHLNILTMGSIRFNEQYSSKRIWIGRMPMIVWVSQSIG